MVVLRTREGSQSHPGLEDGSVYSQLSPTEVLQFILTRPTRPSGLGQLRSGRGSRARCLGLRATPVPNSLILSGKAVVGHAIVQKSAPA